MRITLYRRHTKTCSHQADKAYQRCDCPVWFEANVIGRRWNTDTETWVQTANESMQSRWSSKEKNWRSAEHKARQLEQQLDDILTGKSRPDVKTVQQLSSNSTPPAEVVICATSSQTSSLWQCPR